MEEVCKQNVNMLIISTETFHLCCVLIPFLLRTCLGWWAYCNN